MKTKTSIAYDTLTLYVCNFLSKGWEVSILGVLAFILAEYSLPVYMAGILSTIFIVSQVSVSLFVGRIAHAIGSRNVIFLAIAASGLAWLIVLLSGRIEWLYFAFAVAGSSSGLFEPIGNSLVARSSAKNRSTAIGNFAAFGDMGKIGVVGVATSLAGFFGVSNAALVMFGSTVVALLLARIFVSAGTAGQDSAVADERLRLGDLLQNRKYCYATFAGIADSFSSSSLYIFIPFLLVAKGIELGDTGYYNAVFFVGYMSGRLVLGRMADRYGAPVMLMLSKLGMASLIVVLTLSSGTALLLIVIFVLGIFTRGSSPIIRAMVADSVEGSGSFHDAFGLYSFASRGSGAFCRPLYGFLATYGGIAAAFYAASAISLVTLYPALKYRSADLESTVRAASSEA